MTLLSQNEGDYVRSRRYTGVLHLGHQSELQGVCRVYGPGFSEEIPGLLGSDSTDRENRHVISSYRDRHTYAYRD